MTVQTFLTELLLIFQNVSLETCLLSQCYQNVLRRYRNTTKQPCSLINL